MSKKEVLKSIIFILLFLFLLRSVTYAVRTNGQTKDLFENFYAEKRDSFDVIFVGSSPVYPYYASAQMYGREGIASYNLSSPVQRPKADKYITIEALKTQNPKLFIYEMRMFTYDDLEMAANPAHVRNITDNFRYSKNRYDMIRGIYEPAAEYYTPESELTFHFDIMKYHSNWKTMVLPSQFKSIFYNKKDPLKGYVFNSDMVYADTPTCVDTERRVAIPEQSEKVLYELLEQVSSLPADALFIVSPYVVDEEHEAMFNYIGDIITENGYKFLDMNKCYDEIGLDFAHDFYDGSGHVNARGSEKVSDFMAGYIKDNYDIPDRRGDNKYASWDKAYELWESGNAEAISVIEKKIEDGVFDEYNLD